VTSFGSYLLGAAQLAVLVAGFGLAAYWLRARLLPGWRGAPARLVEAIVAVALVTVVSEVLGTFGLLYAGALLICAVLVALAARYVPTASGGGQTARGGELGLWAALVAIVVIAIVVFDWAVTTKHALDTGIFNFDSLWYHMPFSATIFQSHSTTGMDHVETVFVNWFYPQNSELLHGVGMLMTGRDTLSLFINFGWLAVAFLAAYCVGRPYGRGIPAVIAAAILAGCHTLVVREPGAAKNDLMAAALLLAGIAILIEAWNAQPEDRRALYGWPLAAAGLAVGLAAGTKVTVLALAGALSIAVLVLAPVGRRWKAAGWWFVPALVGGGYWYLRNLIVAGNPIPQVTKLGPITLPHPDRLQEGRPNFAITHYATDTGVWHHYFSPGLHSAFGVLWPLVVVGAVAACLLAIFAGRDKLVRWLGGVALFGLVAYLFTPLGAAGVQGEPTGFAINVRFVIPALLAALVLVPLPRFLDAPKRQWGLIALLAVVFLITDRPDHALHDKARIFALAFVIVFVFVPTLIWLARRDGLPTRAMAGGLAALAVASIGLGYPVERHYLNHRFANVSAETSVPGMGLDKAYAWTRGIHDSRIGLVGTTAGFAGYGFYGPDISNHVLYLGEKGPHGAYNAIPTCEAFRTAVNEAELDYLVTSPFLNFLHSSKPIASPEARWLRGSGGVRPLFREKEVTVWQVTGPLKTHCTPSNAPLREVPDTPGT
jgi:predicted membrane channel-forming protein YqfA (hemolysin III family)